MKGLLFLSQDRSSAPIAQFFKQCSNIAICISYYLLPKTDLFDTYVNSVLRLHVTRNYTDKFIEYQNVESSMFDDHA